jgi:PD-(D/E)XK nuclease superfamily
MWGGCQRKFQLSKTVTFYKRERETSRALSFGKSFGTGIQSLLAGDGLDVALIKSALDHDKIHAFEKEAINSGESLAHVHEAMMSFYHGQLSALRDDWEILDIDGLYGVELGFIVSYANGSIERGFIDVVLQNRHTKEVVVLEVKTSGALSVGTDSDWQNSPQGMMYVIIVQYLLAKLNVHVNSRVLYIEYNKKHKQYTIFPFEKPAKEQADFLIGCHYDVEAREWLFSKGIPLLKSGKCKSYNRQCDFFGVCDLPIKLEYDELVVSEKEAEEKQLHLIDFEDLLGYVKGKLNADAR